MISIGIDAGKTFGFAVYDEDVGFTYVDEWKFVSFVSLHTYMMNLIRIWKPDVVIIAESMTRGIKIAKAHGMYYGVIALCCEAKNVPIVFERDNRMRSKVFGKDKKKIQSQIEWKEDRQDVADAMTAARYVSFLEIDE